ncbi:IS66 family insertion sequence element accessory protein TnpB [Thioalkalicoccus limnaeus]
MQASVYGRHMDMRKSSTGLIPLKQHAVAQNPLSGHLFVFVNRRADVQEQLRAAR